MTKEKRDILLGFGDKTYQPIALDQIYVTIMTKDLNGKRHSPASYLNYQATSRKEFKYHEWPHIGNAKLVESRKIRIPDHPQRTERTMHETPVIHALTDQLCNFIKDLEKENNGKLDVYNFIDRTIELQWVVDHISEKVDDAVRHKTWFGHGM